MFKSEIMKEINLYILKKDLKKVTKALYDLKLVEFFKLENDKLNDFEPVDLKEESKKLLRIRSTISFLKQYYTKNNKQVASEDVIPEVLELKEKLDEVSKDRINLINDVKREKVLDKLKVKPNEITNKNITIGFVNLKKKNKLNKLKTMNIRFRAFTLENRIYFIAYSNKDNITFDFKEFYLPKEKSKNLVEKLEKKEKQFLKLNNRLSKISDDYFINLRKQEARLNRSISIDEIRTDFTTTHNITILSGFITHKDTRKLKSSLDNLLEDKFKLEIKNTKKNAPIKLNNGKYASNFESLLKMYSLPKYGEFDPTTLMFLIFPIFFGFMLGDVIYGLISLIFFTIMKSFMPKIKEFLSVLQISAVSSMIFGWVYGEFLGYEIHATQYGIGLFSRMHNIGNLLYIAIAFGIFHINLGFIIGFFNNISDMKKAVTHYLSWIVLELGILFIYLGFSGTNPTMSTIGYIIAAVGFVLIIAGHGIIGVLEIPSLAGNILSYARLMAVGISSVVIAEMINEFTHTFFGLGVFGVIAGIVLFTGGHIFNIILGNFEAFLHTLRLHYVEYFSKFYSGDGKEFIPFGTKVEKE